MAKRFIAPLILLIALSGCGSSGAKSAVNTTTSTSMVNAADQAIAKKLVITSNDLPANWQAVDSGTDSASTNLAAGVYNQLSTCLGITDVTTERTVLYSGSSFSSSTNTISSGVSGFKTPATVQTELAGVKKSSNYGCITGLIGQIIQGVGASGQAPETSIVPIDGIATTDQQFTLRITTHIKTTAIDQLIYTDLIGVGKGRFVSTAAINFASSAPPLDLEKQILQKLTDHAASAA